MPSDTDARAVRVKALKAARNIGDEGERRRALATYVRRYGRIREDELQEAVYGDGQAHD